MGPEEKKWINNILGSLDGLQRAEPSPFLFAKIRNQLTSKPAIAYVPLRTVWLTAASFALLVMLNWRMAAGLFGSDSPNTGELNTVITDMHLYPTTNQLYDAWSAQNY